MLKVGISGATGLIGTRIIELLQDSFEFVPLLQSQIDISNRDQTVQAIKDMDFDVFLHMAAYTNVDRAEKEKNLAYSINVEGTKNVFDAVSAKKKQFIYISTDFVFDGNTPPYYEDDKPNPISYYGETKYKGEQIIKDRAMIVRFSYPYRARFEEKKDFVKSIAASLQEQKQLNLIVDSSITPTFIDDIAYGLKYCFMNFSPQIIHLVGNDSLVPFNAGILIAKIFHLD
ncbi:sugar nucleotide-binding protein, partial [Candidatus Roizmanbacteria bacterium]|nr:sugar nucleotide-binding protein [Candidatus Roizmanbacteria bacterium]